MKHTALFSVLLLLWLLLTWSLSPQEVGTGIIVCLILTLLLNKMYQDKTIQILNPIRWFWMFIYIVYFIYYCIRANLDVAYRALHPDMPINPGIVKVHSDLKTDIAKTFLANSITLTPGTLTIDIKDSEYYVHWINITTDDPDRQTDIIVKRFERILRRIFE